MRRNSDASFDLLVASLPHVLEPGAELNDKVEGEFRGASLGDRGYILGVICDEWPESKQQGCLLQVPFDS